MYSPVPAGAGRCCRRASPHIGYSCAVGLLLIFGASQQKLLGRLGIHFQARATTHRKIRSPVSNICDACRVDQTMPDKSNKILSFYSDRWYIMSEDNPEQGGQDNYLTKRKLPEDLSCEHCVLMWTWYTAHLCTFPCEREQCGFYADRYNWIVWPGDERQVRECEHGFTPARGERPQVRTPHV